MLHLEIYILEAESLKSKLTSKWEKISTFDKLNRKTKHYSYDRTTGDRIIGLLETIAIETQWMTSTLEDIHDPYRENTKRLLVRIAGRLNKIWDKLYGLDKK